MAFRKQKMETNKIVIELSPKEAEILIGAIAHFTPADKSHEMILFMLYARIKNKLDEFLQQ